jgi:hypothetical protein
MYRLESARSLISEDPEETRDEMIPNNHAFWEMREIRARRLSISAVNTRDGEQGS